MAGASRPNSKELKVLNHFSGEPEAASAFGKGIGEKTLAGMVAKGWLSVSFDRIRQEQVYSITAAGQAFV
jgi:hypothetical protein